ncbi:dnaJ homolog subfamily C member 14 [Protopterus annectens]|uniref:dnaJ homolog subfamily C member 14 n=1 Tax=Protopterus annectens TaxID=7888 RepID=UPI001CF96347|nr:dnaJ homolog subfamily C member 14 [Protopterus annectens]XP_043939599.1 dnaJ homolog subfamily C member 14 [Protopterus annectens]
MGDMELKDFNSVNSEHLEHVSRNSSFSGNISDSSTLIDEEDFGTSDVLLGPSVEQMTSVPNCGNHKNVSLPSDMQSEIQDPFLCCGSQDFCPLPDGGRVNGVQPDCSGQCFLSFETAENGSPSSDQEDDHEDTKACGDANEDFVTYGSRKGGKRQRNQSVSKEDLKESFKKEPRSHNGKHKQSRRRNYPDGKHRRKPGFQNRFEEFIQSCLPYFKIFVDAIIFLILKCGEYVEMGGKLLYSFCCHLQTSDLNHLKAVVQLVHQWLRHHLKSGSENLVYFCGASSDVTFKIFKMIFALLFLVLMIFIGCLRLCWQYAKSGVSLLYGKISVGSDVHATCFLAVSFLHRVWTLFKETRTFLYITRVLQNCRDKFWSFESCRSNGECPSSASSSKAGRYQAGQEVERLLSMAEIPEDDLDPFKVLGVEITATETELKKAYRQLAVLVHPDKNWHPRAEEAFKVLHAAWDIVNNPEKRKEYEMKRMAESELSKSMNEFLTKLQDDLKEAMNTMMCNKCQGKHKRFEMDRSPLCARFCAECNKMHPVEEGDFWAESSLLGLRITYFAMMDGKVYDITEWAGCQRVGISPDTHRVPYHISFGNRNSGNSGRQRTFSGGGPASPGELQDLFNRIFQGTPGQVPNGGLFNPSPPCSSAANSANQPKPESSQKADSKMKKRKKVRRPFQR